MNMHRLAITLSIIVVTMCSSAKAGKTIQRGGVPMQEKGPQQAQRLRTTIKKTVDLQYLLYLPPDYASRDQWPLLLFLHGSGERGHDLAKVKVHGPPALVEHAPNHDFIIVSPQCPDGIYWDNDALLALLDSVEAKYHVDRRRIYLTGISMGGYGVWQLACAAPQRFAAVAPISGWGLSDLAENMKCVPVWAFHGEKDPAVPLSAEQEMVDALKQAGGDVRFTIIPDGGHNVWTKIYSQPEIYQWLLQHENKDSGVPSDAAKRHK